MECTLCLNCMRIKTQYRCEHCGCAGLPKQTPANDLLGKCVKGRYLVGRRHGSAAFEGWDIFLNTQVYLTFRRLGENNPYYDEKRDVLFRNISIRKQLLRPSLPRVLDDFTEGDSRFFVLERPAGTALHRLGRLGAARTLQLFQPLIADLAAEEAMGLSHTDILPYNIVITPGGYARLLDAGECLLSFTSDEEDVQPPWTLTPRNVPGGEGGRAVYGYLKEKTRLLGGEKDPGVYDLCATIYYCLTGLEPPYTVYPFGREHTNEAQWNWALCAEGLSRRQMAALHSVLTQGRSCSIRTVRSFYQEFFS